MSAPPANPRKRLDAMRKGQERARREARREAIRRVRAFANWRAHGFDRAHTPDVLPTDHDFKLANGRRS